MEIVMIGYTGLSEGLRMIRENQEQLKKRYADGYLREMLEDEEILKQTGEQVEALLKTPEVRLRNPGDQTGEEEDRGLEEGMLIELTDGLYAALWNIGEMEKCGLTVELSAIPIRQGTVEVCNEMDVNPYEIPSPGSYLYLSTNGYRKVLEWKEAGIPVFLIGTTTAEKARVITRGEEKRYMDKIRPEK
jgi:thiamine monophosphate kinase